MPLPGEDLHYAMAPVERLKELKATARRQNTARRAGVLALFYPDSAKQTRFVLILRNAYPGVHSAQVSFPGGQFETHDTDLQTTALRETQEEIGVQVDEVQIVRPLTQIYIPPSNFMVSPFLGIIDRTPHFIPDPSEVQDVIEVPLQQLMDEQSRITRNLTTSYAQSIEVPAFDLQGHVVWGATAMMLNEAREMLSGLWLPG